MISIKSTLSVFSLLLVTSLAFANPQSEIHHTLKSNVLKQDRSFVVHLPKSYEDGSNRKYSVHYLLDGDLNLPLVKGVLDRMQKTQGAPEAIVVAIESKNRTWDLTPTVNQDPRGPVGQGGGADGFLSFIEKELISYIDDNYRTHDFKMISGGSIGGLFVLHAMQSKPYLFDAHFAYSPAVWWADRTTAKRVKTFLTNNKAYKSYLYMNMGNESGEMREVYEDLLSFMKSNQPEGMRFVSQAFPDVPHGLTSSAGQFNAYHNLFFPIEMPTTKVINGVQSIIEYYAKVSHQRGKIIAPPEMVVNRIAYEFFQRRELETAVALFKYNLKTYPNHTYAYGGLADVYRSMNKREEAHLLIKSALTLLKPGDEAYKYYKNIDAELASEKKNKATF
ncbi:hypothetical protein PCIT_a4313 [Pseudoalteromonas citrea]|uniref:Esterase n=2 Tax=Pseudoalteromonas citrea TaxID=43655 RepID=A0AAD4FRZ6_9GAMM|nr:alpha/beta hydrolase-fold protein [Pseudoalteromonas citrea]KAF7771248.1 hypothetical protein PCIT_a4313 [Pseudoalteromonas citrea]